WPGNALGHEAGGHLEGNYLGGRRGGFWLLLRRALPAGAQDQQDTRTAEDQGQRTATADDEMEHDGAPDWFRSVGLIVRCFGDRLNWGLSAPQGEQFAWIREVRQEAIRLFSCKLLEGMAAGCHRRHAHANGARTAHVERRIADHPDPVERDGAVVM